MKRFLIDSIGKLDLIVWLLVITFFCGSSFIFNGDLQLSFIGAAGIIVEMMIIGMAVEIIIESLKNIKGIGTISGFITNGPEAICLIVGLAIGDILFAASTPLGSNFMNPILLIAAALICRELLRTFSTNRIYTAITILLTSCTAASFYIISKDWFNIWLIFAVITSLILFVIRPEEEQEDYVEKSVDTKKWLIPAALILFTAGYFLDSVISFAAINSHAPKGVIGFFVLATLTSWPEFKSCMALLSRQKNLAAILNITVSNITNIWLAATGVGIYLFQ